MLRAVGHPVAVNPDAELLRVAREEGWEVMRFERLGAAAALVGAAVVADRLAGGAAGAVALTRRSAATR